jgi:hypothetical protein
LTHSTAWQFLQFLINNSSPLWFGSPLTSDADVASLPQQAQMLRVNAIIAWFQVWFLQLRS